jgi:septal ring factor EnvC (AmiA/AmiB activator)
MAKVHLLQTGQIRQFSEPPHSGSALKGSGGGGTFDDMESKVAALEAHMLHVREDIRDIKAESKQAASNIADIRVNVATLTERVNHLPTKGWGVTVVIALAAFLSAVSLFGPKLLKLVGQ